MARTKDPHAAAVKSWETRRKAQQGGGSDAKKALGDWQKRMAGMFGKGTDTDPDMILGAQHRTPMVSAYLRKAGAVMKQGSKLPPDIPRGPQGECYMNATQLVVRDMDRFDYAEGFAYPDGAGFAVQHAWAVDKKTGEIVDPTWDNPEKARYFGVTYDRNKLFRHMVETELYGVLGGDFEAAIEVMERGGL